jgi:hypothetical protein
LIVLLAGVVDFSDASKSHGGEEELFADVADVVGILAASHGRKDTTITMLTSE